MIIKTKTASGRFTQSQTVLNSSFILNPKIGFIFGHLCGIPRNNRKIIAASFLSVDILKFTNIHQNERWIIYTGKRIGYYKKSDERRTGMAGFILGIAFYNILFKL